MWPNWPMTLRTSSSHEEGGVRDYNILTKKFSGEEGKLGKLHGVRLEWGPPDNTGRPSMVEVKGSEFEIDVDLVLPDGNVLFHLANRLGDESLPRPFVRT